MSLLNLFSSKNQVNIKHKKYVFELYDSPGKWMDEKTLKKLQERMIAIAVSRLGAKPSFSFFVDINTLKNKMVTICTDGTTDYAFNALTHIGEYKNTKVIHLGAVYSTKEDKGLMQLTYLWMCTRILIRNKFKHIYITSLTHTPKIFGTVADAVSNVFPNATIGERPSQFHLDIRDILMDTYLKEWDLPNSPVVNDNFSIKGFRVQKDGEILYPDTVETVPKHRNEKYNKYCFDNIVYEHGDEILQVGIMKATDFFKRVKLFGKGK